MSTDRELLELAAKAAGFEAWWSEAFGFMLLRSEGNRAWNPLDNDGDSLRLAVKTGEPFVVRTICVTTMGGLMEVFDPNIPGDDLRATRRVIVRAAAEIGRNMK